MKKDRSSKNKSSSKFRFDFGIFLLITGGLSNITIWIGAFVATEAQGAVSAWVRSTFLPVLGGISGLAMGITVAAGLVYVISKLNEMKPAIERKVRGKDEYKSTPNIRFYGAWTAIILLLIISPALLAPHVYMTMSGAESLFQVLGSYWTAVWSVGRIVAADLAMSAVALVHGVHISATTQKETENSTKLSGNLKGKKKLVARKPVKDDALLAYLAGNPGASQQQTANAFGVSRQAIGQRVKKLYEVKQ